MKRTKKNRQAECLQTGKSERTAANAAKCANGYGQEKTGSDFRKDEGRGKPLSVFLEASEIKTRQCIYISREIHYRCQSDGKRFEHRQVRGQHPPRPFPAIRAAVHGTD